MVVGWLKLVPHNAAARWILPNKTLLYSEVPMMTGLAGSGGAWRASAQTPVGTLQIDAKKKAALVK